jgi:hypothetical protein
MLGQILISLLAQTFVPSQPYYMQAVQQFSAKSAGARIIILGYAFMVLILINA